MYILIILEIGYLLYFYLKIHRNPHSDFLGTYHTETTGKHEARHEPKKKGQNKVVSNVF